MPLSATETSSRSASWWVAVLLGAATALGACSKPAKKKPASEASSASVSATAPGSSSATVAATADAIARPAVARETLQPPPLSAPADAELGPGGVRYQLLRAGTGDTPRDVDSIRLDFSMWTADGQLAISSYTEPEPGAFSVSTLAPNLRSLLTQLKVGSRVRFWVPRAALAGWKPAEWPDTDLVFELELLRIAHVVVKDSSGNVIVPVPGRAPDAAGPPKDAEATPSGLRYIYLSHGERQALPTADDHLDLVATAYVIDGIEVKLVNEGIKTATTLERAPGKLAEVLKRLSSGDRVRVWLEKGQGKAIIPEAGDRETILDLSVSF